MHRDARTKTDEKEEQKQWHQLAQRFSTGEGRKRAPQTHVAMSGDVLGCLGGGGQGGCPPAYNAQNSPSSKECRTPKATVPRLRNPKKYWE